MVRVMLIEYGVWVARLAVAVVFGLAAWGKAADRVAARTAITEFGVPLRWAPVVGWVLPAVEAVLAVAVLPPWTAAGAAAAIVLLLLVFTAAVGRLLRRGQRPACSCFGAVGVAPIGLHTVVRNGSLLIVAAFVLAGSLAWPRIPRDFPVDRAVGIAVVAALTMLLVRLAGAVRELRRRLDAYTLSALGAEGLPQGVVAPEFELLDTAGGRVTLADLLSGGRRVLLVFVHPACEMCAALAREMPRWHARTAAVLSIAFVGNGELAEHAAWGREQGLGDIPVLVQQGNEAALRYRVRGTPSAVLIDARGRVAAPVARGAMAIRELVLAAKDTGRQGSSAGNGVVVANSR
jgi:peroxiredoxin